MRNKKIILAFLLAAGITSILSYFIIFNGFYSISADESTRSLMAYYWFNNGIIESTSWLPLHFILIGSGFYLLNDLILLPRLISVLFGILTIGAVGAVTFRLFRNTQTTIIAIILTAFLPQRFILSLLPLPEIIYIFFIAAGGYFLFRYFESGTQKFVISASVLWSIAGLLRYESWIFLAVLSVLVLTRFYNKNVKLKQLMLILFLNSLVPAGWIIYNYIKTGSWFYFLNVPSKIFLSLYNAGYADLISVNPFFQFIDQNLVSLNLIGIVSLYLLRKDRILQKWLLIMFLPLIILSAASLTGKTLPAHNFWRIPAVWSVLLVPLTAFTIVRIQTFGVKTGGIRIYIFIAAMLMFQFSMNSYSMIQVNSRKYNLNDKDILTGKYIINYLNKETNGESRILIENVPSYQHFNITLASQHPFKFIYSEESKFEPVKKEKYTNTTINYYLVKSFSKKRDLKRDNTLKQVLEMNNWTLFKKNIPSVSSRKL